jgi:hypothetical protein
MAAMAKKRSGYGGGTMDYKTARALQGFRLKGAATRFHTRAVRTMLDAHETKGGAT